MPHPNDGPTALKKRRKTFDVLRFCDCGRHGGLHGIAPGCPGMAGELLQFAPGESPGTIRSSYDPDFVPQYDAQGNVFLIPIPDDKDGPPLTADVIASYDRELVHAGRKRQTLLTYRRPGNSSRPPLVASPPTATSSSITWGTSTDRRAGTVSTTRTLYITCTSTPSHWAGWSPIPCTG